MTQVIESANKPFSRPWACGPRVRRWWEVEYAERRRARREVDPN